MIWRFGFYRIEAVISVFFAVMKVSLLSSDLNTLIKNKKFEQERAAVIQILSVFRWNWTKQTGKHWNIWIPRFEGVAWEICADPRFEHEAPRHKPNPTQTPEIWQNIGDRNRLVSRNILRKVVVQLLDLRCHGGELMTGLEWADSKARGSVFLQHCSILIRESSGYFLQVPPK